MGKKLLIFTLLIFRSILHINPFTYFNKWSKDIPFTYTYNRKSLFTQIQRSLTFKKIHSNNTPQNTISKRNMPFNRLSTLQYHQIPISECFRLRIGVSTTGDFYFSCSSTVRVTKSIQPDVDSNLPQTNVCHLENQRMHSEFQKKRRRG